MFENKKYAEGLVSVLALPAAILDHSGLVLSCNESFSAAMPDGADCALGNCLSAVFDGLNPTEFWGHLASASDHQHVMQAVELPAGRFRLSIDRLEAPDKKYVYICQLTPDIEIDSSRLRFLLEHLDQGVWNYNVADEHFEVTSAWRRMRGLSDKSQYERKGRLGADWWLEPIHIDDRIHIRRALLSLVSGGRDSVCMQYRYKMADDDWRWILCRAKVMSRNEAGRPLEIVGMDTDVTSLKVSEHKHLESFSKLQLALDAAGLGVWEFDLETESVLWDDKLLEIYGIEDNLNKRPGNLWETYIHPEDREAIVAAADKALHVKGDFRADFRILRPNGEIRYIRSAARFVSLDGERGKMAGVNMDITEDYRRAEELEHTRKLLEYDAQHDALTGLANRRLLDEQTRILLDRLGPEDEFAVLHIDLDHFKQINDTLGHAAGDQVLIRVAEIFRTLVGNDGLVCRNGGDEFVVLLETFDGKRALHELCQAMINKMAQPMVLSGGVRGVGISIGCAVSSGGGADVSAVFLNADVALYAAKSAGRSCHRIFAADVRSVSRSDVTTYHDLASAMDAGQVDCVFQPQYDATKLLIAGAEALVRWNCPSRGLVLPQDFIPAAQEAGLGSRLDEFVMDCVLKEQSRWAQAGLTVPRTTLNVSIERLMQRDWIEQISAKLKPHHSIAFEVLETACLEERTEALDGMLLKVRQAGIEIVLDDFGSGHSSIVALQSVKPDFVKMDRLLIAPLEDNSAQIHILNALVRVARLEGCGVVVEGIETQKQLDAVRGLDCEIVQGYLLGHPMSGEEFSRMLSGAAIGLKSRRA